jgi:uncharacterized RDD family membrane protein YckC
LRTVSDQQQYWQQQPPPPHIAVPRRIRATFGTRLVAYLIDVVILMVPMFAAIPIAMLLSVFGDALAIIGALLAGLVMLAAFVYFFWNYCYRQGVTGQTIGKQMKGIALVREADMQPVGVGMSFARYFIASAISQFTCGIFGIVDVIWILFDEDRQRLTDKILKFHVIELDNSERVTLRTFNPFTPLTSETPPAFTQR